MFFHIKYIEFLNNCKMFQKSLTTFAHYFEYNIFDRYNLIIFFLNIARVYLKPLEFSKSK